MSTAPAANLAQDTIFVSAPPNSLFALDAATGAVMASNLLPSTDAGTESPSPTVTPNGEVLIGTTDGWLWSLTSNLVAVWSNNLLTLSGASGGSGVAVTGAAAVTAGGKVYVGVDECCGIDEQGTGFFSFDTSSNENWFFQPWNNPDGRGHGDVNGSAAVDSRGIIYYLSEDSRFYEMSPSGHVKAFLPTEGVSEPSSSPAITADGAIVVGSGNPYVFCFYPDGLSLRWVCHIPSDDDVDAAVMTQPVIDNAGTVYVGLAFPNAFGLVQCQP